MPGQSFDRVAAIYDRSRGGQRRGDSFAASIAPFIKGRRVVEAGVGTGVIALGLGRFGHDIVGFDLSEPMLRVAIERIGGSVAMADVDRLPLADVSVDTLIYVWVLHLVDDPRDTLAEAARVVRSGGRVVTVLSTPDNHADDEIGPILEGLNRVLRPDRGGTAISLAAPSALEVIHDGFTTWDQFVDTAASQIELIEGRGYSSLFDVDETVWAEVVEPVLERLRAIPDPERPRERINRHPLIVWAKH